MLEVIGMGADADAVYEALSDACPASLDDLSATTGLPRERLRRTLDALEARGLVNRSPGRAAGYVPADPGIALDVLLLEREQQLKRARIWAQELAERHHRAAAGRDPAQLVEIVTGHAAILQRIAHVQRATRHEMRAFDKPPYILNPTRLNGVEVEVLSRGSAARIIYESASAERPERLADLEQGVHAGEQARVLPSLPMKLILIDDTQALVPLQAAPSAVESIVIVHRSALLEAISALFENLWRLALPIHLASKDPGLLDHPGVTEKRILALLTAGLPDDAIARQLGLSGRTYQRRIHDLMERVNARTRFQLARQAARRGWLDDLQGPGDNVP